MQWEDIVIERRYIFAYDERKKNALRSEADIAFLARKSKNAAKSVGFECSAETKKQWFGPLNIFGGASA